MLSQSDFLENIEPSVSNTLERSIALLWFASRDNPQNSMTAKDIATALHSIGHPQQNVSRLDKQLKEDRRTVKGHPAGWRLRLQSRAELNGKFSFALTQKPLPHTDAVIPKELFLGSRGYIERIVEQINKSFDAELFDCTAVMCRRLLETLIIEAFESKGNSKAIKSGDGNFFMLNALIEAIEKDSSINISRNALKGLRDFKQLGDLSAHNRRFNARKPDIEKIRDGLRIAAEELMHLAQLAPTSK